MASGAIGQGSIPALLYDASTQSHHQAFNPQYPKPNSLEDVQGMMENEEYKTSYIYSVVHPRQHINHQAIEQRSLIQIYDSVYYWGWDVPSIGWKISGRAIDIGYDGNYNLTNKLNQSWNDSIWVNSGKYSYIYDASNNQTSEFYQVWNGNPWGAWKNNYLYTYTYDTNINISIKLFQVWDVNTWKDQTLYNLKYDDNNNITTILSQISYGKKPRKENFKFEDFSPKPGRNLA